MTGPRPPRGDKPASPTPRGPQQPVKPPGTKSLVQQIVEEQKQKKAELREAMQRKEKRSRLGPVAAGVLIAANVVAWAIFPPVRDTSGDTRTPAEVERDLRTVIASAAGQVESWRRTHDGRLPPSLAQAGVSDTGLTYVNVDGTVYEVRGESRGIRLSYRSNTLITDFLDAGLGIRK
jgi:hypothetical protein